MFDYNNKKGWGGEDGDFYERVQAQRTIVREREPGLIHLYHKKGCLKGKDVFTDQQINECNWSRDGEEGSELGKRLLKKYKVQHGLIKPPATKPIWQA